MRRTLWIGMTVSLLAVLAACSENDSAISATVAPTTAATTLPDTTDLVDRTLLSKLIEAQSVEEGQK